MLKYISEILRQFTRAQRILVLTFLLLTIVMVYSVPKIVDSLTFTATELTTKINTQEFIIENLNGDLINLNKEVSDLNEKIRINQMECTDQILRREKEILEQLSILEKTVINSAPVHMMDMDGKKSKYESREDVMGINALIGIQKIKQDLQKSIGNK